VRSYLVPDRVFRSLADTQTPQGIAALVRLRPFKLEEILHEERALIMVLVGLQDPGNLGTIVRSLEAFGGGACLLTANTVSPFNPKAVRASAGSLFRVPVFRQLSPERILALCREYGLRTIGLMPRAGQSLAELNLRQPVALFVGQEASGLTSQVATQLDETARIPVAQPVESLNTGTAASVALYEAARQRGYGKEFHGTV
jgi:TrmH family RNA methyltransferase